MTEKEKIFDKIMFGEEITEADLKKITKKEIVSLLNSVGDAIADASSERTNAVENTKSLTRYINGLTSRLMNTMQNLRKEAVDVIKEFES